MTSSLSSLPLELVEDIFSRVPIELLARFKTTSKEWYAFFNDKKFIYKLLDTSQERFIQVDDFDRKSIQTFNPETKALLRLPFSDESHNYVVSETIHCDGLLLCECIERGTYYDDDTFKLAVWNPILRGVTWIEPLNSYRRSDVHGFGYDNVSRDNYKILRINKDELPSEIEIYEFKSKLWRSVDATLECDHMWDSVSINGNMFWIARTVNSEIFIQSFDFSTETFKPICGVPKETKWSKNRLHLSGFRGDRLSLLHHHISVNIDVWVTSKLTDGVVSWIKYLNVSLDPSIFRRINFQTYFIHKTNKIMIVCEELVFKDKYLYTNVYEMGEDLIIKVGEYTRIHGFCNNPCNNVYVPSLVPVPK